jgi:TonB-dependent receptor
MVKSFFARGRAALTLAAGSLALAPGSLAAAQTLGEGDADEIVVIGYRAQNEEAVAAKRADDRVADYLSADDLGSQPDYNIADALRRLPGVQTQFDEDEGRYVAIRGLNPSYSLGSLDGSTLATAERQNRQLNMEAIPAGAIRQVVVTKSRTPDVDGNAIGGTLNLVTRSAFDADGLYVAGTLMTGVSTDTEVPGKGFGRDYDDAPNWRVDGTASMRFGARDQFGVLFGANFLQRNRDQQRLLPQQVPVLNATATPIGAPTAAAAQTDLLWSSFPNTINRYGGILKLEWEPMPAMRTSLQFVHYRQDDNELRHSQRLRNGAGANASFVRFNDFPLEKPLTVVKSDLSWDVDERQSLDVRASYSEATFLEPSNQIQFNLSGAAATFSLSSAAAGVPFASAIDPRVFNASNYVLPANGWTKYEDDSDEYVQEYAVDYGFNATSGDRGFGFGVGAQWREITRDNDRTDWAIAVGGAPLTLAPFVLQDSYTMIYSTIPQFFIDYDALTAFATANPATVTVTRNESRQSDWIFEEQVAAIYGLARHAGDRHTVIIGGRFEETQTNVERNRTVGAVQSRVTGEGDYDHFLPSITLSYDFSDRLRLRAGAFQAVGRPNPSQLASGETVNQTTGAINRGNPDLHAREGDSYEASLEYYLDEGGVLALGVFRKEIANEIVTRLTPGAGPGGVDITQPVNVTSAEVTGVELSVVVNRLPLPGNWSNFGVAANATFIDGSFDTGGARGRVNELQGQSETLLNVALFYERGPFRARASYAYIGEAKTAISATDVTGLSDRFDKATNTVDTQARYTLSDRVELIGEVRNLTNENKVNYTGANIYRDVSFYGRQLWIGATLKY